MRDRERGDKETDRQTDRWREKGERDRGRERAVSHNHMARQWTHWSPDPA